MQHNHALVDWLSFTLPVEYTFRGSGKNHLPDITPLVRDLFGQNFAGFEHIPRKANFYRHRFTLKSRSGNVLLHVFLEPDADANAKTTLFMVTGYALSNRPDALSDLDPIDLLRKVKALGGRLTRVDLALDDFSGRPILAQMIESSQPDVWRDRTITTLCRKDKPKAIWDETLYFGNRRKNTAIAGYDKAKEQGVDFPWFRCEFTTPDRDLCAVILEDLTAGVPVGEVTAGLIGSYLRFVPPGMKAKGNRPTCSWWAGFLKEGAGYELKRHREGKDEEPKRLVSRFNIIRYLKDAARRDPLEVLAAVQELLPDLQLAAEFG